MDKTQQQLLDRLTQLNAERKKNRERNEQLEEMERELVCELVDNGVSMYRISVDTDLHWHTIKRWVERRK